MIQAATVKAVINGIPVEAEKGASILDAAKKVQIKIPTLCKHPDLTASAACGICVVKIKGSNKMLRARCTPLENGMDIVTHDPEIVEVRRTGCGDAGEHKGNVVARHAEHVANVNAALRLTKSFRHVVAHFRGPHDGHSPRRPGEE